MRRHPPASPIRLIVECVVDLASISLFIAAIGLIAGIASGAI